MYLLDTNIVLHATRQGSPVSAAVEAQFQLSQLAFRPAVCELKVGELYAFAQGWGERRRDLLQQVIDQLLVIPIGSELIHRRYGELHSYAREQGCAIQHDHNDMWIAATAHLGWLEAPLDQWSGVSADPGNGMGRCGRSSSQVGPSGGWRCVK